MPSVGDWLECTDGDLYNETWFIYNGLMGIEGWQFQWFREDDAIDGATSLRYEVVADDVGSRLRVQVICWDQRANWSDPIFSDYTDPVTA